jgi:nitrogen fixation protein NifX
MAIRVAAATSDGKVINQHFGAARQFVILDIGETETTYVETRKTNSPGNQEGHNDDLLLNFVLLLSDCKLVLVSKVGPSAKSYLARQGIEVIECRELIDDAARKLQKSKYILKNFRIGGEK